ncbi:MAG: glycosyltransferase [Pseudomonadota bacterium]
MAGLAEQRRSAPTGNAGTIANVDPLTSYLIGKGHVSAADLAMAQAKSQQTKVPLEDALVALGLLSPQALTAARASIARSARIAPASWRPDPRLLDAFGAAAALKARILPVRKMGMLTLIAAPNEATFTRHRHKLETTYGRLSMVIAAETDILHEIRRMRGTELAEQAEQRVAVDLSCRSMESVATLPLGLMALGTALAALALPLATLATLTTLALLTMVLTNGLKIAAALVQLWPARPVHTEGKQVVARQPSVSLLIPLYREGAIFAALIERLSAIDYPRELLDVILVLESDDEVTERALAGVTLPPWMRVLEVPPGNVKTKPRALNFALDHCKGSIIGVYDAEDAPEPAQLKKITRAFALSPPDVACLQGRLDYYNPRKNWLSRCFTLEYATWFGIVLPGLERLRLPIPLGGTTLFFRRDVLEELGAWDAHNVTEDADLGIRLARRGYRTCLVDTVTLEEPNCRFWPWVKQRSRWLKGYAITYLVHMRRPSALLRDLGLRGFIGFQVLFAGSLTSFALAPLLWSFWPLLFGATHPLSTLWGPGVILAICTLFFVTEVISILITSVAGVHAGHRRLIGYAPTLIAYFPWASVALYKALWELLYKPFFWDKTEHGVLDASNDDLIAERRAAAQAMPAPAT